MLHMQLFFPADILYSIRLLAKRVTVDLNFSIKKIYSGHQEVIIAERL